MTDHVEFLIENHPLFPLFTLLTETFSSENLDYVLIKRISLELIRVPSVWTVDFHQNEYRRLVDLAFKSMTKNLLQQLGQILINLVEAEEAFKILSSANEPFKRTRRRLPPSAEHELSKWLADNSKHPYMKEEEIEDFCENFKGVEPDQVRIFLTNSRRRMSDGVRKRSKRL